MLLNSANVNHWTGVENMTSEYLPKYVLTAVCRIMFDLAFYSSKRPILRVVGGA